MLIMRVARSPGASMSGQEVKNTGEGSQRGGHEGGDEGGEEKKQDQEKEHPKNEENQKALDEKIAKYIKQRRFRFLHHFAGPRDPLGAEIHRIAKKKGLNVEVISAERDWGHDLCADEPYNTHLRWAREGLIDGFHAGFPCSTFSRLRFREAAGLPGPVRTRAEPYGKASNNEAQQRECDRGTVMLARSTQLAEEVMRSPTTSIVVKPTSLENPPPSEVEGHLSAWGMKEMVQYLRLPGVKISLFNTCAYQSSRSRGDRHWKPQQFAGSLYGIESLDRECKCGSASHRPIVGKKESKESGEYPWELCSAYAHLLMQHFEKMATAEYLEGRLKEGEQDHDDIATSNAEASQARDVRRREGIKTSPSPVKDAFEVRERKRKWQREEEEERARLQAKRREEMKREAAHGDQGDDEGQARGSGVRRVARSRSRGRRKGHTTKGPGEKDDRQDLRWRPGEGKYGLLKEDKKKEQDLGQQVFVGGLKNPTEVVEGLPTLQNLGRQILGAWDRHCNKYPMAVKVGESYGTPDCSLEGRMIERWKEELRKLTGARGGGTLRLKGKWSFTSPLEGNLFEAWGRRGGDPETEVHRWIRDGVPLGINCPIRTCGIFPPSTKPEEKSTLGDIQAAEGLREDIGNYTSVQEQAEDAEIEVGRLCKLGYAVKVRKKEVEEAGFKGTTISRLGLIVKDKEDGSKKRRIIIDLKRSGGNKKAELPERIILPRPMDAVAMLRKMHALHADQGAQQDRAMELVMIDISDAYMHLAVKEEEKGHCLAPALDDDHWLLFVALLFGFKTAPLTWSRVAAMVARLVQSIIPPEHGMHQVYLDDSLWALCGRLPVRNKMLACILTTMAALGLKLSLAKGARAASVTWVGVNFKLVAPDYDHLLLTLPEKFMAELRKQLEAWDKKGMIAASELRKAAGRVAWLAGILPRARWVTSTFYATLYDHEEDVAQGTEAIRRELRKDSRPKDHLIPVKRLEKARVWLLAYIKAAQGKPIRKFNLYKGGKADLTLLTDASPQGLGAILLVNGRVTKAMASPVGELDAKLLGFELGQSSSQGIVETLAILAALRHWGRLLTAVNLAISVQSDSITALAMTQKFSNSGSALNYLGAELAVACEALGLAELKPVHLPGTANKEADFLSRPDTWSSTTLPAALEGITIETPVERTVEWYSLHPPGPDSAEWQDDTALTAAWSLRP